jgi:hypothetical protein
VPSHGSPEGVEVPRSGVRQISVEEFIPVDRVETMLAAAEALFQLLPPDESDAAINLKRAMVWMVKYIAPTSEFWDWPVVAAELREQTSLRVTFIGLGWVIAVLRDIDPDGLVEPAEVETELSELLDRITDHVDVQAVARLKSTEWTARDIRLAVKRLRRGGYRARADIRGRAIRVGDTHIDLRDGEVVTIPRISRASDATTRAILGTIKQWANAGNRFEGADWCAYKRRRLTVVVTEAPEASTREHLDPADIELLDVARTQQVMASPDSFDTVEFDTTGTGKWQYIGSIAFPRYAYHLGVIHPRVLVRSAVSAPRSELTEFLQYVSYLWVSHYTRIWRYLDFEEQFAYAHDVRRLKELDDQALNRYSRRALRVEELRNRIELMNRIDDGEVNAYIPPAAHFRFAAGRPDTDSSIARLRTTLIPSTVTQLRVDPLEKAPQILEYAANELIRSYGIFTQAASLRMQRVLQILQLLFVVAAVAQVLSWIPIAELLHSFMDRAPGATAVYRNLAGLRSRATWLGNFDISLSVVRILALVAGTTVTVFFLRLGWFSRTFKRLLE